MIETLKSIILDFQEVELETGVPRHLKMRALIIPTVHLWSEKPYSGLQH